MVDENQAEAVTVESVVRPRVSRVRTFFLKEFFADMWFRRIGWTRALKPCASKLPGAYEFSWAFLFVIINRRQRSAV